MNNQKNNFSVELAQLYESFTKDPDSVDPEWKKVFLNLDQEAKMYLKQQLTQEAPRAVQSVDTSQALQDATRVARLIRSFQVRGHLLSQLDPLHIEERQYQAELDPFHYGFTEEDFDREMYLGGALGWQSATLRDIYVRLQQIFTGPIGVEYMHIQDENQRAWLQDRLEDVESRKVFSKDEKNSILNDLIKADRFESFLQTKFPGAKRFSLEGGESTIPALEEIVREASRSGTQEIIIGMAHRGRLNVLVNVMGKPMRAIFSEFEGVAAKPAEVQGSGDVKYHLGASSDREIDGRSVHLSLTANPSHLEAVNPVVVGKVRAKQTLRKDTERNKIMGLLIHGDAAVAGQGIVGETLSLSELPGYRVGGTFHLIINNQIGFTTSPAHSRSSPYCSDVAKAIQAPIFHVNGEDPEAVAYVCRLAMQYRLAFKKDVVVDLFCYRRWGHNEIDEPAFTQPLMYEAIANQTPVVDKYKARLESEGTLGHGDFATLDKKYHDYMQDEFTASKTFKPKTADWLDGIWAGFEVGSEKNLDGDSMASMEMLQKVAKSLTAYPENFDIHKRLARVLTEKKKNLDSGENLDWATGEALAFGTLLLEGNAVRVSGQDSCRGTFSQRHAVFVDQTTEEKYTPLNFIEPGQAKLEILNSALSEFAVMGFEYGYSLADPQVLVAWEAQFGDFANGAQIIIDQFLSSGEVKWLRMSGLVLLLPHGYEGQGPEHSSARLERYLELSAEYNWQVVNCTTPANYFHVLRRQLRRKIRKPLVIMTPKALLRHKLAVSKMTDMGPGTSFQRVIGEVDKDIDPAKVKRVLLCSGKVYYDLYEARHERKIKDVAIVRVEQLYPFPEIALSNTLVAYKRAKEVMWVQEEPENQGSWRYIDRQLERVMVNLGLTATRPSYVGRPAAAATSTGYAKNHEQTQKELVDQALTLD